MSDESAHILVVDDNEMNRDMLSRRLQKLNYHVEMADNGERCLEMMRAFRYDLVMLDIMMPKMNGYEVLETAKADSALRQVPIIMISAVDDLDSVVKCIELGAEDYLFKPFNPVLLKARVSATLDKYKRFNSTISADSLVYSIIADAESLLNGAAGAVNDSQKAVLQRIIDNARAL